MTKLDIQNAYLHIHIHERFRKYLAFAFKHQLYFFKALLFGLISAPYAFTRILNHLIRYLRQAGYNLLSYLNEWILWDDSEEGCKTATEAAFLTLAQLGFLVYHLSNPGLSLLGSKVEVEAPPGGPSRLPDRDNGEHRLHARSFSVHLQKAAGSDYWPRPVRCPGPSSGTTTPASSLPRHPSTTSPRQTRTVSSIARYRRDPTMVGHGSESPDPSSHQTPGTHFTDVDGRLGVRMGSTYRPRYVRTRYVEREPDRPSHQRERTIRGSTGNRGRNGRNRTHYLLTSDGQRAGFLRDPETRVSQVGDNAGNCGRALQ